MSPPPWQGRCRGQPGQSGDRHGPRSWIPNPDRLLLPGMFARVRLVTGAPHKATSRKQAVLTEGGRTSVFIVTGQGVVQRRPVQCGPSTMGWRSVEGLQADEWVVIDHLQRLKEGAKVVATKEPPPGLGRRPRPGVSNNLRVDLPASCSYRFQRRPISCRAVVGPG